MYSSFVPREVDFRDVEDNKYDSVYNQNVKSQKNFFKNLKTEMIVNPLFHLSVLFRSTNYNNPKLDNLSQSSEYVFRDVQNYYMPYEVVDSNKNLLQEKRIEMLKNAKMKQVIYPEVYYIIYTLINLGFMGISYAIFKSRSKHNKL
jgi:hypothetical protein